MGIVCGRIFTVHTV